MLNLVFGRENIPDGSKMILDTRIYFRKHKKPEWFEDDFVKRFLKVVDKSEVLFEEALKDYKGRGVSTDKISTGCKTLCDIYYNEDTSLWFYGTALGANCLPFLLEIVREKDVNLFFQHYPPFPEEFFEENLIRMNGKVTGKFDLQDGYAEWCEAGAKELENDEEVLL